MQMNDLSSTVLNGEFMPLIVHGGPERERQCVLRALCLGAYT